MQQSDDRSSSIISPKYLIFIVKKNQSKDDATVEFFGMDKKLQSFTFR